MTSSKPSLGRSVCQPVKMRIWEIATLCVVFFRLLQCNIILRLCMYQLINHGQRESQAKLRSGTQSNVLASHLPTLTMPSHNKKCQWMKIRNQDWRERVVMLEFTDSESRENFCMSRVSSDRLCLIMEPVMMPKEDPVRTPVPLLLRVAVVSYKLGSCCEYHLVANQFGVHKVYIQKVCVHVL